MEVQSTASAEPESERGGNAGPADQDSSHGSAYNPFVSHDFLSALEESRSVGGRTGWHVQHVLAKASDGALVAAAPAYLKSHSRGEYVFDAGWAEAYERAGGSYYPKLQIAVPFTPATGPRLLVRDGLPSAAVDACAGRRPDAILRRCRRVRRARDIRDRDRVSAARRARLSATHRSAVSLGKPEFFQLRRFSRRR